MSKPKEERNKYYFSKCPCCSRILEITINSLDLSISVTSESNNLNYIVKEDSFHVFGKHYKKEQKNSFLHNKKNEEENFSIEDKNITKQNLKKIIKKIEVWKNNLSIKIEELIRSLNKEIYLIETVPNPILTYNNNIYLEKFFISKTFEEETHLMTKVFEFKENQKEEKNLSLYNHLNRSNYYNKSFDSKINLTCISFPRKKYIIIKKLWDKDLFLVYDKRNILSIFSFENNNCSKMRFQRISKNNIVMVELVLLALSLYSQYEIYIITKNAINIFSLSSDPYFSNNLNSFELITKNKIPYFLENECIEKFTDISKNLLVGITDENILIWEKSKINNNTNHLIKIIKNEEDFNINLLSFPEYFVIYEKYGFVTFFNNEKLSQEKKIKYHYWYQGLTGNYMSNIKNKYLLIFGEEGIGIIDARIKEVIQYYQTGYVLISIKNDFYGNIAIIKEEKGIIKLEYLKVNECNGEINKEKKALSFNKKANYFYNDINLIDVSFSSNDNDIKGFIVRDEKYLLSININA